jgi:hypothetical protein
MNKILENESYNSTNNRFGEGDRYQIIYPYESDIIHVKPNIDSGVYSCYKELQKSNTKNPLFMVHNLDSGTIYHLEVPKFKSIKSHHIEEHEHHKTINDSKSINLNIQMQPQQTIPDGTNDKERNRVNDIVTRLNKVEYQLDILKKKIPRMPKKEDSVCTIC